MGKPDIPKEKVPLILPKKRLEQAGKQVGEQGKNIAKGKAEVGGSEFTEAE